MVTDGGGWTLVTALRADTPWSWKLSEHKDKGLQEQALAGQAAGDVTTTGTLREVLLDGVGRAGKGEMLIDIGHGLFRLAIVEKVAKTFRFFHAIGRPDYAQPHVTAITRSPLLHAPAETVEWLATDNKMRTDFCDGSGCEYYLPFGVLAAGARLHSTHKYVPFLPAAGYDFVAPHASKVFLR